MPINLPEEDKGHDSLGPVGTVYNNDSEDPVNVPGGGTTGLRPEDGSLRADYGYSGGNLVDKDPNGSQLVPIAFALVIAKYTGLV